MIPITSATLQQKINEMKTKQEDMLFYEPEDFNKWNSKRRINFMQLDKNDSLLFTRNIQTGIFIFDTIKPTASGFLAIINLSIPVKHSKFYNPTLAQKYYKIVWCKMVSVQIDSPKISQKYHLHFERAYRMLFGGYKEHEFLNLLNTGPRIHQCPFTGIDVDLLQDNISLERQGIEWLLNYKEQFETTKSNSKAMNYCIK
jgi:hypothetical protein